MVDTHAVFTLRAGTRQHGQKADGESDGRTWCSIHFDKCFPRCRAKALNLYI